MKYSNLYIIATLLAAGLASCTKSDVSSSGFPDDSVVRISASVEAPEAGVSGTRAEGSTTTSTPYSGSTLGLFLDYGRDSNGDPAMLTRNNVLWENNGSNSWTSKDQVLWGKASDKVGVYAYAPYLDGQTDASAVEFTIPTDQSEGLGAADLLWWYPGIENGSKTEVAANSFAGGNIDIAFKHALIKLTVTFELGTQFDGKNISIKEAWFHRSSNKVKIDFSGLSNNNVPCVKWAYDEPDYTVCSIKMHNCSTEKELSCEILFFPCSLKKDSKLLTVTLSDGRDYILTLDEELDLKKYESGAYIVGAAYEMTVKIGKDNLKMGTVTVAPWINKDNLGQKDHYTDATEYSEWAGPADIAKRYAGGSGTSEDPFLVATASQLAYMAQEVNKGAYVDKNTGTISVTYFKLTSNIDLMGNEWIPIGENESYSFTGKFDGAGHTILNFKVTDKMYAGLFGFAEESAEIKNLVIRNASVKSKVVGEGQTGGSGIVVGWCNSNSSISDCSVEGISTGDCYVGGIVGCIDSGKISDCTAEVSCLAGKGSYSWCGGIAGYSINAVTIDNCLVRGNIIGTWYVGGLVGYMEKGMISTTMPLKTTGSYADVSLSDVCDLGEPEDPNTSTDAYYVGGLVGDCRGVSEVMSVVFGKVSVAPGLDIRKRTINLGGYIGYAEDTHIHGNFMGSVEAGQPSNGTLNAGIFMGYLGTGVTARKYCLYDRSGVGDLPVYGTKADDADDSSLMDSVEAE